MAAWRSTLRATCLRQRLCVPYRNSLIITPNFILARLNSIPLISKLAPLSCTRGVHTTNCALSLCAQGKDQPQPPPPAPQKPGIIQRFKEMYRDYWYVLVPVHLVTSAVWLGGFYYLVRSGVDIAGALESLGVSERFISPLRESKAGYVALMYACYKLATPLRYTVTLGGTTIAIKKLTEMGWIKPVPSRERLREMYQERKEGFQDAYAEKKEEIMQKTEKMRERRDQVIEDLKRYKQDMKDLKKQEVKQK